MSRTKHHYRQRRQKWGWDFGARYKHNRCYCGGTGPQAKDAADSERRIEGKKVIRSELSSMEDE